MSQILVYLILIAMAIGCFVGGNFCAPGPAQQGLVGLGGLLVGLVGPHLPSLLASLGTETISKPSSSTPVVCLLALGSLLIAGQARAAGPQALGCLDAANSYCVVPAAAVGWQVNLKTGGAANAASLVGLSLQHAIGSLPLGLGVYAGLGASSENRGSYQGCIGASITSWGLVCGGAQRIAGDGVWQAMLTFAPQLTFGGTPSYVASQGGGK